MDLVAPSLLTGFTRQHNIHIAWIVGLCKANASPRYEVTNTNDIMLATTTHAQTSLLSHLRHRDPNDPHYDPALAFKVGGVDVLAAMDSVRNGKHADNSSDEEISDLSALDENATDDFGRQLLHHQRELRLRGGRREEGKPQAFRRAPRGAKLSERVRLDPYDEEVKQEKEEEVVEPPLNYPREWGRRAGGGGKGAEWLRGIRLSPPGDDNGQAETRQDEGTILPHRTLFTGDSDPNGTPPSMRRRVVSSPSSMHHMHSSVARSASSLSSPDEDFNDASLLASTPAANSVPRALRRGGRKIDHLTTAREIASIEARGVTTRTLDGIFEASATTSTRPLTAPSASDAPVRRDPLRRRRSLINTNANNKENVQPSGSNSFKGTETTSLVARTAQAVSFKKPTRPEHKRNSDSIDLLRRLSRVSNSPSPGKGAAEIGRRPASARSAGSGTLAAASEEVRNEAQMTQSTPSLPPPQVQEDDVPSFSPSPSPSVPELDLSPETEPKTPVVTGAYLATPQTSTDLRPLLLTTDSTIVRAFGSPSGIAALEVQSDPLEEAGRSGRAKSALADILAENGGGYGDATLASLMDIVAPDRASAVEANDTIETDIEPEAEVEADLHVEAPENGNEEPQSLTQAEQDRRREGRAMEEMNKHLRNARTSIKEADRGLRRVENRLEESELVAAPVVVVTQKTAAPSASAAQPAAPNAQSTQPTARQQQPSGKVPCATCGSPPLWRALLSELRSCFFVYPTSTSRARPTYLTLLLLLWLAWYALESTLCAFYCNQTYASTSHRDYPDPEAPRYPFAIPTLLFRPAKPVWGPAWEYVRWGARVVGYAFVGEEAASAAPAVTRPVTVYESRGVWEHDSWATTSVVQGIVRETARVGRSVVEAVDEVGRMWDDELVSG